MFKKTSNQTISIKIWKQENSKLSHKKTQTVDLKKTRAEKLRKGKRTIRIRMKIFRKTRIIKSKIQEGYQKLMKDLIKIKALNLKRRNRKEKCQIKHM